MANSEVKGISFPFRVGGRGSVVMSGRSVTDQQHIKEDIMQVVGVQEGERVMNLSLGLEDLGIFFDDLNETTKSMVSYKIIEKLQEWEPRIEIVDIQIDETDLGNGTMAHVITLSYQELATGDISSVSISV